MGAPIADPKNPRPPNRIMTRKIVVRPNELNTVRLMHDRHDSDAGRWFIGSRPVRRNNEVLYLVRGKETFDAMAAALATTIDRSPERGAPFIYWLAWNVELDLPMGSRTLEEWLTFCSQAGVEIRTMFWRNVKSPFDRFPSTLGAALCVSGLPTGRAILDDKTTVYLNPPAPGPGGGYGPAGGGPLHPGRPVRNGSHHQKVLMVNGSAGLVVFCGGLDPVSDRLDKGQRLGFDDVHCQIRGPAAIDLVATFQQRWNDYLHGRDDDAYHDPVQPQGPNAASRNPLVADEDPSVLRRGIQGVSGCQIVQIGRTFPRGLYSFAPNGDRSVREIILHVIRTAEHFVYIEDQYLLNMDIADVLAATTRKPGFRAAILVIGAEQSVDPEMFNLACFHRKSLLDRVRAVGVGRKVRVFLSCRFTHSKIVIADDRAAVIGSANCNRRGWENDSEVVACIADEGSDEEPQLHFAHRLRIRLWADHLNLREKEGYSPLTPDNDDEEFSELVDPVGAMAHWWKFPANVRVRPYVRDDRIDDEDHEAMGETSALMAAIRKKANSNGTAMWIAEHLQRAGLLTSQRLWDDGIDPRNP